MKKILTVSTILLIFGFGSACADKSLISVTSSDIDPRALLLLNTMTIMAGTVESLGQTVTAYAFTPTPSNTPEPPTKVPDATELRGLLSDTIKDELIATLGANISVVNVSFGPVGAQEFTELYIEIKCESQNNSSCPSSQAVAVVVDTCKDKKKKVIENIPNTTKLLVITIYDPGHSTQIVETDWSDVLAYMNGDIQPEIFIKLLRYVQY